jgi:PAS domain S-box-containing protein
MQQDFGDKQVKLSDAQTILDSITDAFFSLNGAWEFSYVNRQTEKILGRQASDLLGKSIWEVYPGTVGSDFERMYRRAAQERMAGTFSSYYPDHNRWYEVNVYPAQDGLSVYFRDVTVRKQDEARRNALLKLADLFRDLTTSEEITYGASQVLGETLGVSRVGYGTIDPVAETMHVIGHWNASGVETLDGLLHLRDYGSFIDDLKAGNIIAINDVDKDGRTAEVAAALKRRNAGSLVNVPVIEQNRLVAVIFVNHAKARNWWAEELAFIKEVAERTRTASERLRNERELAKVVADSERRRRLYETFLENSPDLAYVFDLNHRFTYANKVLLDMWNRTWEEAIGKNCLELGYEPWHAEMHDREIEQVIATKQSIRGEVPFQGAFGRRIYEYIFVPVLGPDGTVEAIAGTTRDVTERKQAEEALRESNRRKDEFLAMLAHELRNPLAPISAAAQLLKVADLHPKHLQNTGDVIARQVKHMTALVDDLLDVSRVTTGLVVLDRTDVDVKKVVADAVEQVRPLIKACKHYFSVQMTLESAQVQGDYKRLVQVIANLINNAAKYTQEEGTILTRVDVRDGLVVISVKDNGIGISPELLPKVFELFVQGERTPDRSQGGLGLGLALVKSLVELHGGSVSVDSKGADAGSTFTVRLPRLMTDKESTIPANEQETVQKAPKELRVMVVDDNADAADMLGMFLETRGYHVTVEHDAHTALERVKHESFDAFLLDIGLPGMNGNELARRLRVLPQAASALMVAITGYGSQADRECSLSAGFDAYIVKPADPMKVIALLSHVQKS